MDDYPPIYVLLTTYKRTETALKTIQGIIQNFQWPNLGWVIVDDGTGGSHLGTLANELGGNYTLFTYDSQRRGVGHGMNWGLHKIWEIGANLVLVLEDDWLCEKPFDPSSSVRLLMNHDDIGMVRYGYLHAGLQAEMIAAEGHLWWKFLATDYTYTFSGHAALRHSRFHGRVGYYAEGLTPGQGELDFCAKYNGTHNPPAIVWPAEYGIYGPFVHIGAESLASVQPET